MYQHKGHGFLYLSSTFHQQFGCSLQQRGVLKEPRVVLVALAEDVGDDSEGVEDDAPFSIECGYEGVDGEIGLGEHEYGAVAEVGGDFAKDLENAFVLCDKVRQKVSAVDPLLVYVVDEHPKSIVAETGDHLHHVLLLEDVVVAGRNHSHLAYLG